MTGGVSGSGPIRHDWLLEGHFISDKADDAAAYTRSGKKIKDGGLKNRFILQGQDDKDARFCGISARVVSGEGSKGSGGLRNLLSKDIIIKVHDTDTDEVRTVAISKKSLKQRFRLSSDQLKKLEREAQNPGGDIHGWEELRERAKYIVGQHKFIARHEMQRLRVEHETGMSWRDVCHMVADDGSRESTITRLGDDNIRVVHHTGGELDISFKGERLGQGSFAEVFTLTSLKVNKLIVKIPRSGVPGAEGDVTHDHEMIMLVNPDGNAKGIVRAIGSVGEGGIVVAERYDGDMGNVIEDTEKNLLLSFDLSRVVDDLISGLATVHEKGVVHGDIKPENILVKRILLNEEGDEIEVRCFLADFGGASSLEAMKKKIDGILDGRSVDEISRETNATLEEVNSTIKEMLAGWPSTEDVEIPGEDAESLNLVRENLKIVETAVGKLQRGEDFDQSDVEAFKFLRNLRDELTELSSEDISGSEEMLNNLNILLDKLTVIDSNEKIMIRLENLVIGSFSPGYSYGSSMFKGESQPLYSQDSDHSRIVDAVRKGDFDRVGELRRKQDVYATGITILQSLVKSTYFTGRYPSRPLDQVRRMVMEKMEHKSEIMALIQQFIEHPSARVPDDIKEGLEEFGLEGKFISNVESMKKQMKVHIANNEDLKQAVVEFLDGGSEISVFMKFCCDRQLRNALSEVYPRVGLRQIDKQKNLLLRMVEADPDKRPPAQELAAVFSKPD